jgi:hypothetical protein
MLGRRQELATSPLPASRHVAADSLSLLIAASVLFSV